AALDLSGAGAGAVRLLETLDQINVLGRFIPEWSAVRNRPRPGAHHRYTVDRHLMECVGHAGELTRTVHRPDLLLVAALLHEISGDEGITTGRIARRMGFGADDVAIVRRVVGNQT